MYLVMRVIAFFLTGTVLAFLLTSDMQQVQGALRLIAGQDTKSFAGLCLILLLFILLWWQSERAAWLAHRVALPPDVQKLTDEIGNLNRKLQERKAELADAKDKIPRENEITDLRANLKAKDKEIAALKQTRPPQPHEHFEKWLTWMDNEVQRGATVAEVYKADGNLEDGWDARVDAFLAQIRVLRATHQLAETREGLGEALSMMSAHSRGNGADKANSEMLPDLTRRIAVIEERLGPVAPPS